MNFSHEHSIPPPPPPFRPQFLETRTIDFCTLLAHGRRRRYVRYTAHRSATCSRSIDRHLSLSSFSLPALSPFSESSRSPAPNRDDFSRAPILVLRLRPRVSRLSSRRRLAVNQTQDHRPRRTPLAFSPAAPPSSPPPLLPPPLSRQVFTTCAPPSLRCHKQPLCPRSSRLFTSGKICNLAFDAILTSSNLPSRARLRNGAAATKAAAPPARTHSLTQSGRARYPWVDAVAPTHGLSNRGRLQERRAKQQRTLHSSVATGCRDAAAAAATRGGRERRRRRRRETSSIKSGGVCEISTICYLRF